MKPRAYGAVCYGQYFYGLKTGNKDEVSQSIEQHFGENIENPLSKEWPLLLQRLGDATKHIDQEDKRLIAGFMIHMWLRSPSARSFINGNAERMYKQVAKIAYSGKAAEISFAKHEKSTGAKLTDAEKSDIKSFIEDDEYSVEFSNKQHLKFMLDPEHQAGFTNLIFHQDWIIHISRANRQFMTSDTPLVILVPETKGFYGATFLQRTHLFPLSPTLLVEARPPKDEHNKK